MHCENILFKGTDVVVGEIYTALSSKSIKCKPWPFTVGYILYYCTVTVECTIFSKEFENSHVSNTIILFSIQNYKSLQEHKKYKQELYIFWLGIIWGKKLNLKYYMRVYWKFGIDSGMTVKHFLSFQDKKWWKSS